MIYSVQLRWMFALLCILSLAACGQAPPSAAPTAASLPTSESEVVAQAPDEQATAPPAAMQHVEVLRLPGGDFGLPSPFTYSRGPGFVRMSFIYDTLIWKDSEGFIPWLATEWTVSADGTRWEFTLREGVRWHDGTPLTVDDVVFTFDYLANQPSAVLLGGTLEIISSVEQLDEQRVAIVLEQPYAPFLSNIAGTLPIIPRHIWEEIDEPAQAATLELLIGSGPYQLTQYDQASGAYLYEANQDFWLGTPYVQRIELVPVADALLSLQQGAIDATGISVDSSVTAEVLAPFREPPFAIMSTGGEWNAALHFNLAKGPPYDDVRFRQALAYTIDREELVQRVLLGNGEPGNPGGVAPSSSWYNPDVAAYAVDRERAAALLDEAGYQDTNGDGIRTMPDGQPLDLQLYFDGASMARTAELLRAMLQEVGIPLTLRPNDRPSQDALTADGNYGIAIIGYGGLGGDPDRLRQTFASTSRSRSFSRAHGYANPTFDQLASEQFTTTDEAQRKALVFTMQELLAEDVPVLPLYHPLNMHLYRPEVFAAWYYTPGGIGSGVPIWWNKHAFVTGTQTGLPMRDGL
ncbi:ABC transporter substrate-binding protein [Candidatus Viridilinea mediisalina]|uniref:Solute-binding protein family 5 domain-containing protein n=1 Tax=Candidatus Viridilinea mediisalina TaxID=2024553 RepID=A0A2A6RDL3_9CHLR|nr:ABC transporter substrate-binding protein [Candidatus Viridilinea mediisalina]PDV99630.1 hypothetical protein CJ255_21390 [Candidatus Viridilinea mediisalina]